MTIKKQSAVALGCIILMTSCTTTGDPTQGGLWGWSEEKNIQRVNALRAQEAESQAAYDSIIARRNSKQAQLNRATREAKAATRAQKASTESSPAKNTSEIESLERDVKLLEIR